MTSHRNRLFVALAAASVLVPVGTAAPAQAAPVRAHPASQVPAYLTVSTPVVGGLEIGPGSVPGGPFQQVTVRARPAIHTMQYPAPPAAVDFWVADVVPWNAQVSSRYLTVSWRNLRTGKSGRVNLRHWRTVARPGTDPARRYPASLPTAAVAPTGAGRVVATVSVMREQHRRPPVTISLVPGLVGIDVP
ncbi:hypothetical protein [Gordonia hydrophobica]|uniref:Uncharacterized protein n=1 Tax=Gordonia hydrophobica TaxID=40516 RepID=A0ABZ2TZW7_9ACTN|nr:hypothetical protein [Gordonia hydrophobica]MBM7369181.1 hypothetical protein [Gordonia hydrophobica]